MSGYIKVEIFDTFKRVLEIWSLIVVYVFTKFYISKKYKTSINLLFLLFLKINLYCSNSDKKNSNEGVIATSAPLLSATDCSVNIFLLFDPFQNRFKYQIKP